MVMIFEVSNLCSRRLYQLAHLVMWDAIFIEGLAFQDILVIQVELDGYASGVAIDCLAAM